MTKSTPAGQGPEGYRGNAHLLGDLAMGIDASMEPRLNRRGNGALENSSVIKELRRRARAPGDFIRLPRIRCLEYSGKPIDLWHLSDASATTAARSTEPLAGLSTH
jgi:hypothetical protein